MGIYLGPLRFTRRGVRARIGPRLFRLHIGAGGPGISTGAGPFTYYKSLRRRQPVFRHSGCLVNHRTRETMLKCKR